MQSDKHVELSDRQMVSAAVLVQVASKKGDITLKNVVAGFIILVLTGLLICAVVAIFKENYTAATLLGVGPVTSVIIAGAKILFSNSLQSGDDLNLIQATQKLLESNKENKSE